MAEAQVLLEPALGGEAEASRTQSSTQLFQIQWRRVVHDHEVVPVPLLVAQKEVLYVASL
jgi:hypothetical protein